MNVANRNNNYVIHAAASAAQQNNELQNAAKPISLTFLNGELHYGMESAMSSLTAKIAQSRLDGTLLDEYNNKNEAIKYLGGKLEDEFIGNIGWRSHAYRSSRKSVVFIRYIATYLEQELEDESSTNQFSNAELAKRFLFLFYYINLLSKMVQLKKQVNIERWCEGRSIYAHDASNTAEKISDNVRPILERFEKFVEEVTNINQFTAMNMPARLQYMYDSLKPFCISGNVFDEKGYAKNDFSAVFLTKSFEFLQGEFFSDCDDNGYLIKSLLNLYENPGTWVPRELIIDPFTLNLKKNIFTWEAIKARCQPFFTEDFLNKIARIGCPISLETLDSANKSNPWVLMKDGNKSNTKKGEQSGIYRFYSYRDLRRHLEVKNLDRIPPMTRQAFNENDIISPDNVVELFESSSIVLD